MRGAPAAPPTTSTGEGGLFFSNSNDRPCYAYNGGACNSLLDTTSSLDASKLANAVPASSLPKPTTSALGGVYLDADCVNGHVSGIDYTTGKLKCTADAGSGGGAGLGSANTFTAQNTFAPTTDVPTIFNLPSGAAGPIASFRLGGVEKGRINADGTYSVISGIPALRGIPGTPPTTGAGEVGLFGKGTGFCIAYNGGSCVAVATGTPLTNPMTTAGDLIVGGASGVASRLAVNASGTSQFLKSVSGATSLAAISLADLPALYYQTVRSNGTVQAQEPALNFGTEFTVADNSGSSRTDVSLNAIAESKVTNLVSDLAGKQAALGFTAENSANKDANSGYAGLDSGGKLKTTEFPALTGDVTSSAGGVATTIVNAAVNTTKSSTGMRTRVKNITSFAPAQNDLILALNEGVNITLTRVWCAVPTGSTSIAMNVEKRAESTVGTTGTAQLTGNVTCGTSGATGTLIASPAIAAHTPVLLTFPNAPTGSPAQLFVEIEYTVDTGQ